MEAEWKEDLFAFEHLISDAELAFGDGESVAQMETTVHVRIRKCDEIFFPVKYFDQIRDLRTISDRSVSYLLGSVTLLSNAFSASHLVCISFSSSNREFSFTLLFAILRYAIHN